MVQNPSWKANWFAASQEIPRISRNPKVHYRTHKRPPPVSILGQPNPVHIPTSHLLEIRPNIIHPSTPRSPQWSPSLRFPHQDPIHSLHLTHTRHMPSPSHSSRFYPPHNIGWGVQIIWLLVMQSPPFLSLLLFICMLIIFYYTKQSVLSYLTVFTILNNHVTVVHTVLMSTLNPNKYYDFHINMDHVILYGFTEGK